MSYKVKFNRDASKFFICVPSKDSYVIHRFSSNEDYYFFIHNFSKYKFHFTKEEIESYIFGRDASVGIEKKEFIKRNITWGNISVINDVLIVVDLLGNVEYKQNIASLMDYDLDLASLRYNKYYAVIDKRINDYIDKNSYVELYNSGNNSFYVNLGNTYKEYRDLGSILISFNNKTSDFKKLLNNFGLSNDKSKLITVNERLLNDDNAIDPGFYLSQYDTIVYNTYNKINIDIGKTKIKSNKNVEELYLSSNALAFNPFSFSVSSRASDNENDKDVNVTIHLNEEDYSVKINNKVWGILKNLKIDNLYQYYALAENWMYLFICKVAKITPFNYLVNSSYIRRIIANELLLNKFVKRVDLFSIKNYDSKDSLDETVRTCSVILEVYDRFNKLHHLFLDFRLGIKPFYLHRLYETFNRVLNGSSFISNDLICNIEKSFLFEMSYNYNIDKKSFNDSISYNLCTNISNSMILDISSIINYLANV